MPNLTAVPDPAPNSEESGADPKATATRPRTSRPLPTDRISYAKQLAILRAFAVAAAENEGMASANNAEAIIKMSHVTISLATPFFVDAGFLARADRGRFKPADALVEYTKAHEWSPDQAGHHLAPVVRKSWFGQIITSKVAVYPREQDDVLAALAGASGASTDHRQQVSLLVDFAILAGLVRRDGTLIRRVDGAAAPSPEQAPIDELPGPQERLGVRSTFSQDPTEGYVEFHVDVKVRTAEFATWRPERITAFFGGIAQVLAAKGGMEEDASSE